MEGAVGAICPGVAVEPLLAKGKRCTVRRRLVLWGFMRKTVFAVVALLALAGCQTPQQPPVAPEAPEPPTPVVPKKSAQPKLPVVRSAGPLAKANVGTYMDAAEGDLRDYLRGQPAQVARRGDTLAVTVQSDRIFSQGDVSDWGDAFVRALYLVLGHYDFTKIEVVGYSDNAGGDDKALAASQKRAKVVADELIRYGIAAGRVTATGLGASDLRVANAADPKNRRIVIKIVPAPK